MKMYTVTLASHDDFNNAIAHLIRHYKVIERTPDRVLMELPRSQWWSFLFYAFLSLLSQSVVQEPGLKVPEAVLKIPQGTKTVELRIEGV